MFQFYKFYNKDKKKKISLQQALQIFFLIVFCTKNLDVIKNIDIKNYSWQFYFLSLDLELVGG